MKYSLCAFLFVFFAEQLALAELRLWQDRKGNYIEAELIGAVSSDKVRLKTGDKRYLSVPVSGLCDKDREYLEYAVPINVVLSVNIHRDKSKLETRSIETSNVEYNSTTYEEKIRSSVVVHKKSSYPCPNRQFTVYLYIFGEGLESKNLSRLGTVSHTFHFKEKKKVEYSDRCGLTRYIISSSKRTGTKYNGYLAVLEDDKGTVVAVKASRSSYEKDVGKFHSGRLK